MDPRPLAPEVHRDDVRQKAVQMATGQGKAVAAWRICTM
jgi:hypothetical protein